MFLCVGLDVSEPNPPSEQLQVGQNITITVNISGNPVPCNWNASFVRGDGQDIPDKGNRVSIVNNTIIFRNLTEDDVGRYNITVSNGAIERVVFFELTCECNRCTVYLCLLCVLFTVPTEKANAQHTRDA